MPVINPISWRIKPGLCVAALTLLLLSAGALAQDSVDATGPDEFELVARHSSMKRRPIALSLDSVAQSLLVANRASGSIVRIDTSRLEVTSEWRVANEITDFVHWRESQYLILDFGTHQLKCLDFGADRPILKWKIDVPRYPVDLCVTADNKTCSVIGLWSRRIMQIDLAATDHELPQVVARVDLPFAPGIVWQSQVSAPVFVIDAFGDQFAVLHPDSLKVAQRGHFSSRRVGGLAANPNNGEMVMSQQLLNRLGRSTQNDVHWGLVVANELRVFPRSRLLARPFQPLHDVPGIPLGGTGDAKGDPGFVSIAADGTLAISLGGVDQIALGRLEAAEFVYVDVGRRPMASVFSADSKQLYVVNFLDESVSVVQIDQPGVAKTVVLSGDPAPKTLADRGERLFFDARLSHDGWMSCHSCHIDGHTSGFLNDNFSDQTFGTPKRILSLRGHGKTAPFAWNGSASTLEDQIEKSLRITMQADEAVSTDQVQSMAAYVQSLKPPPSRAEAKGWLDQQSSDFRGDMAGNMARGQQLFTELGCSNCHAGTRLTSEQTYDVDLPDELGHRLFNPPSLLGVSQRDRLFHDGSAVSIEDVVRKFRHRMPRELSCQENRALLDYLMSL